MEKDQNLKDFYLRQLERINRDPEIFTNKKFINSLNEYGESEGLILKKYKESFLFIKETIDLIIQSLIDKITTIPYTLRCICKIIYLLISKKFNKISNYERNAFIGEFIFGKCILPILINSDINAIITTTILANNTRQCLRNISKVLTKINRGIFFESNSDTDFTIFNHYIIEVIPIINNFYSELINVEFPKVLEELINKYMSQPEPEKRSRTRQRGIFRIRNKQSNLKQPNANPDNDNSISTNSNNEKVEKKPTVEYSYFDTYPDESVRIQCVCFSIEDIIQLIHIIRPKINEFSELPQFTFFEKTIDRIYNEEHKLAQKIKDGTKVRKFFVVFKEETNTKILYKKDKEHTTLTPDEQDANVILKRVKYCIKTVLRGINLINRKDYSYFNIANSTNNFFIALKMTLNYLNEDGDFGAINKIPLKWYGQYMSNNKKMIPDDYKGNDYEKLYEELLNEETISLNNMRNSSGILMTRNGMNMRCAEKIIENAKRDLLKIKEIEKFMKMEKFITNSTIHVCIRNKDEEEKYNKKKGIDMQKQLNKNVSMYDDDDDENTLPLLFVKPMNQCCHVGINPKQAQTQKQFHAKTIKDFIDVLSSIPQVKDDVKRDKPINKCYATVGQYLGIVYVILDKSEIFSKDNETEKKNMLDRIEDYIMKKMYNKIFPKKPLDTDKNFYENTLKLSWIKPIHLEIKKIYESELKYAQECIRQIDDGKSPYAKLECIANAHNTINNTIKFSSGKDSEAGAEELSPIFQYITIKAHPKRFISNINYIKSFLNPNKGKGMYGFLLSQMEFSASFINNITHENLKITKEEYDKLMQETEEKNRQVHG